MGSGDRPKSSRRSCARALLLAVASSTPLIAGFTQYADAAVTMYWDGDGSDVVGGGTGTWDLSLQRWSTSPTGNTYAAWVNANTDDAFFGNAPDTVTIGVPVTARSLWFDVDGYILSGSALTLNGAANGTINVVTGTATIANQLSGTTIVVKTGSGSLTLSAANNYSGKTQILGGAISIGADNNLGAAPGSLTADKLLLDGGTLRLTASGNASGLTANRGIAIGNNGGTIEVSTVGAVISNSSLVTRWASATPGTAAVVTKTGPGTFRNASGAVNTFDRLVVANGLWVGNIDQTFGAIPGSFLANAITLNGGGISAVAGSFNVASTRGITLGANGGTIDASSNIGIVGVIAGTQSGGLIKTGTGVASFNAINTYDGFTRIDAGIASLATSTSTFGNGNGELILNGGTVSTLANKIDINAIPNPLTIQSDSTIFQSALRTIEFSTNTINSLGGQLTIFQAGSSIGQVRFSGNGFDFARPIQLAVSGMGGAELAFWNPPNTTQTFSGIISGQGSLRRSSTTTGNGGTTILSGANTFSGDTKLVNGFLGFGVNTSPASGAITSGPIGIGPLTLQNGTNGVFASGGARFVRNAINFDTANSFIINGSDDLTLSGDISLGSATRTFIVNNTALTILSGNISNTVTGAGIVKQGNSVLLLSGSNTFDGATSVSAGTLRLGHSLALGTSSGSTIVASGAVLDLNGLFIVAEDLAISGSGISNGGALINSNTLNAATIGFITLGSDSSVGGAGTLNFINTIGGNFALTKVGGGNARLTGANTYTGKTNVNGGVLEFSSIGNVGTTSALGKPTAANAQISLAGILRYIGATNAASNRSVNLTAAGSIESNTPGVSLTLSGGITGSGALTLAGAGNGESSGSISAGITSVTKLGSGTWKLSASNGYAGATTISAGTLRAAALNALPSSTTVAFASPASTTTLDLSDGAGNAFTQRVAGLSSDATANAIVTNSAASIVALQLDVPNSITQSFGGAINGALSLNKTGDGTQILTNGNSNFTGGTTVAQGVLVINNGSTGSALGSGNVAVSAGATLAGNGKLSGNLTLSGTLSPGNSAGTIETGDEDWRPGGTLTLDLNALPDDLGVTPGIDWDLVAMQQLNVSATSDSPTNKFTIKIVAPALAGWDPEHERVWKVATYTTANVPDLNAFAINSTDFNNPNTRGFELRFNSGELDLAYVPEPAGLSLALLTSAVALRRRRRCYSIGRAT
jgi:autotransporter-associated beta strand protein